MKAAAHQGAIPTCAATWRTTRYLTKGDQSIGRRGDILSVDLSDSVHELDPTLGPDETSEGGLEDDGELSWTIVDVWPRMER